MVTEPDSPVAAYKRILSEVLERRPSGTRQRLAGAMGKNRSFVSQITNPAYATPVPASHLDLIFELCHFSAGERQRFLSAYERAHPRKSAARVDTARRQKLELPDLGDAARNRALQILVTDFVIRLTDLMTPTDARGKRP